MSAANTFLPPRLDAFFGNLSVPRVISGHLDIEGATSRTVLFNGGSCRELLSSVAAEMERTWRHSADLWSKPPGTWRLILARDSMPRGLGFGSGHGTLEVEPR